MAGVVAALTPLSVVFAQSAEPTYTLTLPDKQRLRLEASVVSDPQGRRIARVASVPTPAKKNEFLLEATAVIDADGAARFGQAAFGISVLPPSRFEAKQQDSGDFTIVVPEERGTLPFGAPLVTTQSAQMFLGRLYQWDKGGEQNFALFVDFGWKPLEIVTLKLKADGTENVELADGKVTARRLRYEAAIPHLGDDQRKGVFYIGPLGEILRCDSAALGLPFKLRGPVKREEQKRLVGAVFLPTDRFKIFLNAERTEAGYDIALKLNEQPIGAKTTCDAHYIPTRIESPWRGRPLTAIVEGNNLHYSLAPGVPEIAPVPSGRPWFIPFWILTELWESGKGTFAGMKIGETREGDFLPLVSGLSDKGPFTLERQPDKAITLSGETVTVTRYRLQSAARTCDLYTDGSRLLACLSNDDFRITRDGLEEWAASLKPPSAPVKQEK